MSTSPTPVDAGRRDGRALRSVAVFFFVNGMVYATFVPRLPEIRDRVGISIGALGAVLMLGAVAGIVASFLTGPAIGALGTRPVMIVGAVLSVGSLPVIGSAASPAVLVIGLMGIAFFDVFMDVAMNIQGSVLSARRHAPVMNRLHGLWSLATVTGGIVTAVVVGAGTGVAVHLTIVAAALLAVVALAAPGLLVVDEPHAAPATSADGTQPSREADEPIVPAPTADRAPGHPDVQVRSATVVERRPPSRRRRLAWALGLGGASAMTLELTAGDWAAFRLGDDLGADGAMAAAGFVAFTVGMTSGRLAGDSIQLRIGVDRLLVLASSLAFLGLAVAALVDVAAIALLGLLTAGLGVSVLFPQLYDAAARSPGRPGSGFAWMLIGQRSAALLTPLAVGALAGTDALDVGAAMAIVSLPAAAVAWALAVGRRRRLW